MNHPSLRFRLGMGMGLMLVVTVSAFTISAIWEFRETMFDLLDHALQAQVAAVEATMTTTETPDSALPEIQSLWGKTAGEKSPVYRVWLEDEQNNFAISSHESWPLDWSAETAVPPAPGGQRFFNVLRGQERAYRLIWSRSEILGADADLTAILNVVVANYCGEINGEIFDFVKVALFIGGTVLLCSILFVIGILGWGLKPVTVMTRRMNDITGKNLSQPAPFAAQTPAELEPFVRSWDEMIERLALALKQQRRFTGDASHELRTPLAVAKSTLQAARSRSRTAEEYEKAIDQSLDDLARLEDLTEQLLTLTRLDDICELGDQEEINLKELVADVCREHFLLGEAHEARLKWQVDDAVIKGDPEQIKRLLGNLIENAIKHGPAGGEIRVSMQTGKEQVAILVHDEGGGIAEEETQLIFERFYRVKKARDRASGGAGLGLAIAREIARRHGGDISVTSSPQSGTEFTVTLPLFKAKS